jgi:hypothetical protein
VNGVEARLTEAGSGTQIGAPMPIFQCAMPAFQVTVPGGLSNELDVRVWDESAQWAMRVQILQPTASLAGDGGLRIGTWADLHLDPRPPAVVALRFHGDAGCAYFAMDSNRSGAGCTTDTVVSNVDCAVASTDAGAACPLVFTDGGVSFLVPDIGAVSGTLEVDGWPPSQLVQCEGLATCWLNNQVGIGGPVGLNVMIRTETVP